MIVNRSAIKWNWNHDPKRITAYYKELGARVLAMNWWNEKWDFEKYKLASIYLERHFESLTGREIQWIYEEEMAKELENEKIKRYSQLSSFITAEEKIKINKELFNIEENTAVKEMAKRISDDFDKLWNDHFYPKEPTEEEMKKFKGLYKEAAVCNTETKREFINVNTSGNTLANKGLECKINFVGKKVTCPMLFDLFFGGKEKVKDEAPVKWNKVTVTTYKESGKLNTQHKCITLNNVWDTDFIKEEIEARYEKLKTCNYTVRVESSVDKDNDRMLNQFLVINNTSIKGSADLKKRGICIVGDGHSIGKTALQSIIRNNKDIREAEIISIENPPLIKEPFVIKPTLIVPVYQGTGKEFKCKGKHQYREVRDKEYDCEGGSFIFVKWVCQCGKVLER